MTKQPARDAFALGTSIVATGSGQNHFHAAGANGTASATAPATAPAIPTLRSVTTPVTAPP